MKLLNKIKNRKSSIVLMLSTVFFLSCTNYIDVNTDTDQPQVAPLNSLLTSIQVSLGDINDFNSNSGSVLGTYTHQFTSREEQDQYNTKVNNTYINNDWDSIYLTLTNLELLIQQGTDTGNLIYVGIGQIQKAYIMSVAVDLWGDVPYSEASKLASGIISPKFDDQKAIYASIFALLEAGKINVNSNAGAKKPLTDDLIYGGNKLKWVKFANTLKLKLYNQTRLTSDFDQAGLNTLLAENKFFSSNADDFQLYRTTSISPTDERNRLYIESYNSTQFGSYISPWFYEILKGMNPTIHTGNPDPRIPYYIYNQLTPNQFPPDQGNASTGNPGADYWDKSTGFFSIRFGSTGPDRDKSAENSYSYPGIFPSGGRYDDGQGGTVDNGSDGTGIAPHRILTYDEMLYIQAELILAGKMTGNAATKFEAAVRASFAKVDQVVVKNLSLQTIPTLVGTPGANTFINNIKSEYAAATSDARRLEIIMTQKWVGTFGDPMDQYTDYRRTGYPILANPRSSTNEYQLNNGDAFPLIDSQTTQNNEYQLSLYWPQFELNTNQNAPSQKVPSTYKIFWDN